MLKPLIFGHMLTQQSLSGNTASQRQPAQQKTMLAGESWDIFIKQVLIEIH